MLPLSHGSPGKSNFGCCLAFYFLSQTLSHFLGKGVEELLFLPSAVCICKTEETAQFAAWEGISSEEREDHKPALDAEDNTSLVQPEK